MKTKKYYFTVLEVGNSEAPNIGTIEIDVITDDTRKIVALDRTDKMEFNNKLVRACEAHFDATVKLTELIELGEIIHSNPKEFEIIFDSEDTGATIEIQETWIY